MPIAIWASTYETGNPTVDGQHKQLFEMVNELHHGIVSGHGRDVMGPLLKRLAKYAVDHFATEEGLMRAGGYPDYSRHKGKHDALTAQVVALLGEWEKGTALPGTLSKFLADWVSQHIKEEDFAMIQWLKARG